MSVLWCAVTTALAVVAAPAATAAKPLRGAAFVGDFRGKGNISFGVSRDGRRVFGMRGVRIPGVRSTTEPASPSPESRRVSGRGTFRGRDLEAPDSIMLVTVRARFTSPSRVRGSISYVDREGCGFHLRFTARGQPPTRGLRAPAFPFAFAGTRTPHSGRPASAAYGEVTGLDELPDGSLVASEGPSDVDGEDSDAASIWRIGTDGRLRRLLSKGPNLVVPADVAALADGSYLIADVGGNCVRRADPSGAVTTVAGICGGKGGFSGDGGPATAAQLLAPASIDTLPDGAFLIADQGVDDPGDNTPAFGPPIAKRVRRVAPDGTISTVAGNGTRGFCGDGGAATAAALGGITDITAEPMGGFLLTDAGRVRRVAPNGIISTVAGTGLTGFGGDGGPATSALLEPAGVFALPRGGFLVGDRATGRVRAVSPGGRITTIAGAGEGADGNPANRAHLGGWLALVTHDGSVVVSSANRGLDLIPGRRSRRLLVGVPAHSSVIGSRVRHRRPFSVVTTGRGLLTVEVRRRGRLVTRLRKHVRTGRTAIRLRRAVKRRGRPGADPIYRLVVTLTSGRRVSTTSVDDLF